VPQGAVRHLVFIEVSVCCPGPTALLQISPQRPRRIGCHGTIDALTLPDDGENVHVVVEDHEARPTCGQTLNNLALVYRDQGKYFRHLWKRCQNFLLGEIDVLESIVKEIIKFLGFLSHCHSST
jgi:hypothetical protein